MKTLKIPEQLHHDLAEIKAKYNFTTFAQTIRFLHIYWKENKEYDQSKK